eukprot:352653-Chlamydomonas_euryale.AAC.1
MRLGRGRRPDAGKQFEASVIPPPPPHTHTAPHAHTHTPHPVLPSWQVEAQLHREPASVGVLAGDWNMTPRCPLYEFISAGRLDLGCHSRRKLAGQVKGIGHCNYFAAVARTGSGNARAEAGRPGSGDWAAPPPPQRERAASEDGREGGVGGGGESPSRAAAARAVVQLWSQLPDMRGHGQGSAADAPAAEPATATPCEDRGSAGARWSMKALVTALGQLTANKVRERGRRLTRRMCVSDAHASPAKPLLFTLASDAIAAISPLAKSQSLQRAPLSRPGPGPTAHPGYKVAH